MGGDRAAVPQPKRAVWSGSAFTHERGRRCGSGVRAIVPHASPQGALLECAHARVWNRATLPEHRECRRRDFTLAVAILARVEAPAATRRLQTGLSTRPGRAVGRACAAPIATHPFQGEDARVCSLSGHPPDHTAERTPDRAVAQSAGWVCCAEITRMDVNRGLTGQQGAGTGNARHVD